MTSVHFLKFFANVVTNINFIRLNLIDLKQHLHNLL